MRYNTAVSEDKGRQGRPRLLRCIRMELCAAVVEIFTGIAPVHRPTRRGRPLSDVGCLACDRVDSIKVARNRCHHALLDVSDAFELCLVSGSHDACDHDRDGRVPHAIKKYRSDPLELGGFASPSEVWRSFYIVSLDIPMVSWWLTHTRQRLK